MCPELGVRVIEPSLTTASQGSADPGCAERDETSAEELASLLEGLPRRQESLIEGLHRLQDRKGAIRKRELALLADLLGLPTVVPYEVATFYAHFDVIEDDAPIPPPAVRVCDGLPCALAGAAELIDDLRQALPRHRVLASPCLGACHRAPVVLFRSRRIGDATTAAVAAVVAGAADAPLGASGAVAHPYRVLRSAPEAEVLREMIRAAGLRGLGGAGFPAWRKWEVVARAPAPKHLVVNADEGEPGTFKDRYCLEQDPDRVLEGMLLAARAVGAETCWIYLRDEYADLLPSLAARIATIKEAGLFDGEIVLRRGAGAYVCGEETALLESLEGKRGYPRHKPPFPGECGLFGRPTLIHNVETLWWLPEIVADGPDRFAAAGRRGRSGKRLVSVSGRVRHPGVYEVGQGTTAREIIDECAGGMAEGHRLAAYLPGGASGGILPARLADLPLDFGTLEPHGCFVGSGALIVLSDRDDLVAAVRNLVRFFRDESCGQCTPCRVGTAKATLLLDRPHWDRDLLEELAAAMADGSICGLGQAALNPVRSLLRFFPEAVP